MRNEAAGFRRLSEEYDGVWAVDLGDMPAIFEDIAHYVGLDGVVHADVIFDRIADFIDPTCEVEGSGPLYMDDETEFLLSCGHVADMVTDCPPAFCPKCGARVVDGERGDAL